MKKKLLIIGCGDHGIVCAKTASLSNSYSQIAFLDDNKKKNYKGYKIIGNTKDIETLKNNWNHYFISFGDNNLRRKFFNIIKILNKNIINIKHPSSTIDKDVKIGKGNIFLANTVISNNVKIGDGNIINNLSSIDHDVEIKNFVHVSPGVNVAGNVSIGSESWIGIGSKIINNINIGKKVIVGAGSVVLNNVRDNKKVFGIPAK
tara:strand:+ start:775 stop:1386 length:612 start_codon:yes stop_codon:yes gene_type:complete